MFDSGSAELSPEAYEKLATIAADINRNVHSTVVIEGHTDSEGDVAANIQLSLDRANAVKRLLVAGGVDPSRIDVSPFGSSDPIASNATSGGRRKNRRVIILVKQAG